MQSWELCNVYMELDAIFKPSLEFLNFVKMCQNQNLMDLKFEELDSNSDLENLTKKKFYVKTEIGGSL
jgi:hypothetical protein